MEKSCNLASRTLCAGRFLALEEVTYRDETGTVRRWESCVRARSTPAVMLVPVIRPGDRIVLIRQFRPPTGRYVWETPAGLMEQGEKPEETALRELYEETGYTAVITKVLPPSFSSCGLSGESVYIVFADIDGKRYGDALPENHPDGSEQITVHPVPLCDLAAHLEKAVAAGDAVDSKLLLLAALTAPQRG